MKNKTVKIIIAIISIILMCTFSTFVKAEDTNYTVSMSLTSNSKLKAGDTIVVNINLTNINAGEGINSITGKLTYDTNVLEAISTTDFASTTAWSPSYSTTTNKVTFLKNTKVTAAETVATITFKVKETLSVTSTTITLEDIVVSGGRLVDGGTDDINVNKASVTINAETPATPTTEEPTPTVKDTTTKNSVIPKTGIGSIGFIAILVVALIGIVSYSLYKKTEKIVK